MENLTKKKGGRPIKESPLERKIKVNVTKEELDKFKQLAEKANYKLSPFARELIVNGKITNLFSKEEQNAKIQLIGIANNLNQLLKECHTYGILGILTQVKTALDEVRLILDRYNLGSKNIKSNDCNSHSEGKIL